jgi:ATP-dependent RNA helicase RhlE
VADNIDQRVMFVDQADKKDLLVQLLRDDESIRSALVFTRTRHRASRIARQLSTSGISADAIHADKSQGARQKALAAFDKGRVRVLVATDIVARGIDVDGITHVINFEIPNEAESYVHRIGRTARAGAAGIALSFCNPDELEYLADIEKLTGIHPVEVEEHPYRSARIAAARIDPSASRSGGQSQRSGQSGNARGGGGGGGGGSRRRRGGGGGGGDSQGKGGQGGRRSEARGGSGSGRRKGQVAGTGNGASGNGRAAGNSAGSNGSGGNGHVTRESSGGSTSFGRRPRAAQR